MTALRQFPALPSQRVPLQPTPVVPAEYAQSTLSWGQLLAMARAHIKLASIITVVLLVATVVIVKLLPKSYTAQATVMINFESNDAARAAPPDLFTSYLSTQVELLQSRDVLLTTIDRLGLTKDPEFTAGFKDDGIATLQDYVEKNLRGKLTVEQAKAIQLIYVSATSDDRNKAARIANTVVAAYQARTQGRGYDSGSSREREYSDELNDLKSKVTAAQEQMADFRKRTGLTDIGAQNDVENQVLATLQQQLLAAENQRRTAEARGSADQGDSDQAMASQVVQTLKNQLSTLQGQLAQLSSTLGPKHPRVVELQSQITATRRSLDHEIQSLSQNTTGEVTSSRQLEVKLQRAVDDEHAKILKLRALQDEGQKLQLELESAQTVYKRSLDSYDQTMFASASLASRAVPPLAPSKPKKPLLAAIGALFALLAGVVVPVGYELLFNRRLHCRADIEQELGVPVLAEFGRISGLVAST